VVPRWHIRDALAVRTKPEARIEVQSFGYSESDLLLRLSLRVSAPLPSSPSPLLYVEHDSVEHAIEPMLACTGLVPFADDRGLLLWKGVFPAPCRLAGDPFASYELRLHDGRRVALPAPDLSPSLHVPGYALLTSDSRLADPAESPSARRAWPYLLRRGALLLVVAGQLSLAIGWSSPGALADEAAGPGGSGPGGPSAGAECTPSAKAPEGGECASGESQPGEAGPPTEPGHAGETGGPSEGAPPGAGEPSGGEPAGPAPESANPQPPTGPAAGSPNGPSAEQPPAPAPASGNSTGGRQEAPVGADGSPQASAGSQTQAPAHPEPTPIAHHTSASRRHAGEAHRTAHVHRSHDSKHHRPQSPITPSSSPAATPAVSSETQSFLNALPAGLLGFAEQGPPAYLLPIYRQAGHRYHVPWRVLAAINQIETDYGRNLSVSSAGAIGWMQFMPATWQQWGLDADHDGQANPYSPRDAIFTAARYLQASGAERDLAGAVFSYNHAQWYVSAVLLRARMLAGEATAAPLQRGYSLPLDRAYMSQLGRTDDGVDIETAPDGALVYSMTPGVVSAVASDPAGFGPNYPVVEATSGSLAGQHIYYGHVAQALVRPGEIVAAGQAIAIIGHTGDAAGLGHGHIEIGFSDANGVPVNQHGVQAATPAGAVMRSFLIELSAAFGVENA
jgi:hypothetical protein